MRAERQGETLNGDAVGDARPNVQHESTFSLSSLAPVRGTLIRSKPNGIIELALEEPLGCGTMRGRALSAHAFAAVVDFSCSLCPVIPTAQGRSGWLAGDTWFSINLCLEGRCEVDIPHTGLAVVSAGDLCISHSRHMPDVYRYPLGRYRGIELFVSTDVVNDPAFYLLKSGPRSLEEVCRAAGDAAVLTADTELNHRVERIGELVESFDPQFMALELLELLIHLERRDLTGAHPRSILTRAQADIARSIRAEIDAAPELSHDARDLARRVHLSAATLNSYFSRLYGETIASYLRRRRVGRAAEALSQGATVAEAAIAAGYANPSKFAAAFRRIMGEAPNVWRQKRAASSSPHSDGRTAVPSASSGT